MEPTGEGGSEGNLCLSESPVLVVPTSEFITVVIPVSDRLMNEGRRIPAFPPALVGMDL